MSEATFGVHAQVTGSWFSHCLFSNFSKAAIFVDDVYGVDNNMFSHLTFENNAIAFHQHAPASQREPGSSQCKQPWDNKNLDYMDKTVFYRNRVVGGDDGQQQAGFILEPCRSDGLNMWFENEFSDLGVALSLSGNSDPIVASSIFTNCGKSVVSAGNIGLFNSLISVGPNTEFALPSQGDCFIEGCKVVLGQGANATATILAPGQQPTARDQRAGGSNIMLMGNQFAAMPLGISDGPLGPINVSNGFQHAQQWVLVNNQFASPLLSNWSKAGIVLLGYNATVGGRGPPRVIMLDSTPADVLPGSQLLFGPEW
jgi:hypothetical protein